MDRALKQRGQRYGIGDPASRPNDPRLADTTTLTETNLVAKQVYRYDDFNNKTEVDEYDFGSGTPGALKRRTHTNYLVANIGYNYTVVTEVERDLLLKSLKQTSGNKMQAAKLLNMKRTTFVEKLKRLGISEGEIVAGYAVTE